MFKVEDWLNVDNVTKYNDLNKLKEPSVHFSIIFNAFVMMTLFNEIYCRKLQNERNCFQGIRKNLLFCLIWIMCMSGQILIVNFGSIVFNVTMIDFDHWVWCLLIGFGVLIWGQVR